MRLPPAPIVFILPLLLFTPLCAGERNAAPRPASGHVPTPQATTGEADSRAVLMQLQRELAEERLALAALQRSLDEEKRKIRHMQQRVRAEQQRLATNSPRAEPPSFVPPTF